MKKTITEFKVMFANEEKVINFLFTLRWPDGFICSSCLVRSEHVPPARRIVCPKCGNNSSLTTDTILHGTKKSLSQWLLAIWWLSANEQGASAKELQRLLNISSYQTAWTWLQKLRLAISLADRKPCQGIVEIGCSKVRPAAKKPQQRKVMTAAERIIPVNITGRIRMGCIDICDEQTLLYFLRKNVSRQAVLVGPGFSPFTRLQNSGYSFIVDLQTKLPERIDEINRSFEIWLHKIHRGGVSVKHLQLYLDEFCFHNNSTLTGDRKTIFTALVHAVLQASPISYKTITTT